MAYPSRRGGTMSTVTSALKKFNITKTSSKAKDVERVKVTNAFALLQDDDESTERAGRDPKTTIEGVEGHSTYGNANGAGQMTEESGMPNVTEEGTSTHEIEGRNTAGAHRNGNRQSGNAANTAFDIRQVNWRAQNDDAPAVRQTNMRTIGTRKTQGTRRSRMKHQAGARTRNGIMLEDIFPGIIMWRPDKRPCVDPNIKDDDPRVFFDNAGVKWLHKGRFWLVIYRCRDHVTELPIYTYNNNGLEKKPALLKETYNSIKPPHATDFVNQSPNQKVLEIDWVKSKNEKLRKTMVVHVTEPMSRDIDLDSRVVACLEGDALRELVDQVKETVGTRLEY